MKNQIVVLAAAAFLVAATPNAMAGEATATFTRNAERINTSAEISDFNIGHNIAATAKLDGFYENGAFGGTVDVQSVMQLNENTELSFKGNYAHNAGNDGFALELGLKAPETKIGAIQFAAKYQEDAFDLSFSMTDVPLAFDGHGTASVKLTMDGFRPESGQAEITGEWDRFKIGATMTPNFDDFEDTEFGVRASFNW